jgi:hypothetical protein
VAEQQLNGAQISGAAVDQGRLGPPHGMRREFQRIEADAADPLRDEARVLARGQMLIGTAAARGQALPWIPAAGPQIVVQRLPCHLCQLEPNRSTGLPLPHVGAVHGVTVGRHVIDTESDEIAAAQLAVDREVE